MTVIENKIVVYYFHTMLYIMYKEEK